jgi:hypothetical protein
MATAPVDIHLRALTQQGPRNPTWRRATRWTGRAKMSYSFSKGSIIAGPVRAALTLATKVAKDLGSHSRASVWIGQSRGGIVDRPVWSWNVHHNYFHACRIFGFRTRWGIGSPNLRAISSAFRLASLSGTIRSSVTLPSCWKNFTIRAFSCGFKYFSMTVRHKLTGENTRDGPRPLQLV